MGKNMLNPKTTIKSIHAITSNVIELALCVDQNFPTSNIIRGGEEISVADVDNSIFLHASPYSDMYRQARESRAFNFIMIDGALLLMQYRFKAKELISHRLSFFPSPGLLLFQNESEVYWNDEIFADMIEKQSVGVPLRFDFDPAAFREVIHPASHLTLGQYSNCRIPVSSPLTPYQFVSFVIKHFYDTKENIFTDKMQPSDEHFCDCISDKERNVIYIKIP
jgi:hypothetical protein